MLKPYRHALLATAISFGSISTAWAGAAPAHYYPAAPFHPVPFAAPATLLDSGSAALTNNSATASSFLQTLNTQTATLDSPSLVYPAGGTLRINSGSASITNSKLIVEDTSIARAPDLNTIRDQTLNSGTLSLSAYTLSNGTNNILMNPITAGTVLIGTFPSGSTNGSVNAGSITLTGGVLTLNTGSTVTNNSLPVAGTYTLLTATDITGIVDIQDLTTVANHWQQPVTDWSQTDASSDAVIDVTDLAAVANNWQSGTGSTTTLALAPAFRPAIPVPEPGSLSLLAISAISLLRRRKP